MAMARRGRRAPFGRRDESLLARPLDYIQAENLRHRELCLAAERLAEHDTLDVPLARAILGFLETDMTLHVMDEEEDLFPVLRRRLKPGDDVARIIGLLSGEHAADKVLTDEIIQSLKQLLGGGRRCLPEALRNALLAFADRQRRHVTVENAIMLPLARLRLSKQDLERVASRMAARRHNQPKELRSRSID